MKDDRIKLAVTCAVLFGIYCFVFGKNGYLERRYFKEENAYLSSLNGRMKTEIAELSFQVLSPEKILHEEAYRAGFVGTGERMVHFAGFDPNPRVPRSELTRVREDRLESFRIIWVIVSTLVILFLFMRKRAGEEE